MKKIMKRCLMSLLVMVFLLNPCVISLAEAEVITRPGDKVVSHPQDQVNGEAPQSNMWIGDVKEGNKSYLDENGLSVTGLYEIEGKVYFFNSEGVLQTGWQEADGQQFYFDNTTGERAENTTISIDGVKYQFDEMGIPSEVAEPEPEETPREDDNQKVNPETEGDSKKNTLNTVPDTSNPIEAGSVKNGWTEENGNTYYYDSNGMKLTGLQKINGEWYYFNKENGGGELKKKGWIVEGNKKYYALADGRLHTGWLSFGNTYYYCSIDKTVLTGLRKIGTKWYYFNKDGVRQYGWIKNGSQKYYALPDGSLHTGWLSFGKTYYYCSIDKSVLTGLRKIGTKWYYFNKDGVRQYGWIKNGSQKYYALPDGSLHTGWLSFGKTYYYCSIDKTVLTGLRKIGTKWYYFNKDGVRQYGWIKNGSQKYYALPDGSLHTGWLSFGKTYYYCSIDKTVLTGLRKIGSKWYYFNKDGVRQYGWINYNGKKYYALPNGSLHTGWLSFGKTYYYCNGNGEIVKGNYPVDGILYTFDNNGIMQKKSGWGSYNGNKYYLNPSTGFPYKGWVSFGTTYYYANSKGIMVSGWHNISGDYYYFYPDSKKMARNTTIDGYVIGANGKRLPKGLGDMSRKAQSYYSPTGYLLLVNRATHKVGVFAGRQGAWTNMFYWDCGDGAPSTPTVTGVFKVGMKGYYFDSGSARCFWYTQFYGNYLFHTVLCYKDGRIMDGRVGMALSHGCVRLQISNAKWIYDNIPRNTTVVVY